MFSVLLSIPLHTINFPVLIPVLRLSGGFYCLLYKLCFWFFFPLMVPFSFNLLLLENRYYLKYGLKLRPFRDYVCSARYPVTANPRALYQLEGSVISDRKPWGLACDYEFAGGGDLSSSTQHQNWDRQSSLLPISLWWSYQTPA